MSTTVETLINAALRKLGNNNPSATEIEQALEAYNFLIDSWAEDNMFVPYNTRENLTLTEGQAEYTIGLNGNLNTARPVKIDNAYIRSTANVDYVLEIINPKEYNEISKKNTVSIPARLFFLPEYPLAKIIFDCPPSASYLTLHIDSVKYLTAAANTTEIINLPAGYMKALIYNLAIELEPEYGVQLAKSVYFNAAEGKDLLEKSKIWKPSECKFDTPLASSGRYDIKSGIYI